MGLWSRYGAFSTFVFESTGRNKEEQTFPVKIRCSWALSSSSGAVGGLVKSVTDFIRPDFACLSGDSTQCLFSFKPPPALLRLPLPPQHPSAVTWWTWNELFAASASSSSFFLVDSWILSLFFFVKFGDDLTLLYPFWIRPSGRFSRSISS